MQTEAFTSQLENLPITADSSTWKQSFGRTMFLARFCGLSSYDAAYLELATRESLMLTSLDRTLVKAAKEAAWNNQFLKLSSGHAAFMRICLIRGFTFGINNVHLTEERG